MEEELLLLLRERSSRRPAIGEESETGSSCVWCGVCVRRRLAKVRVMRLGRFVDGFIQSVNSIQLNGTG